jgi:hypothetical protein
MPSPHDDRLASKDAAFLFLALMLPRSVVHSG